MFLVIFLLSILFLTSFYKEGFETYSSSKSKPIGDVPNGYMRINDTTMIPLPEGIDFSKVKYLDKPSDGILPFEHIEISKKPDSNVRVMVNIKELSEDDQKKIHIAIQSTLKPVYIQEDSVKTSSEPNVQNVNADSKSSESKSSNDFREKQSPNYFESHLTEHASDFPGNNKGFCNLPSIHDVNKTCNNLSKNICASTSCCVLLGGEKCVAGNERGPTEPSSYQGNKEFYYYDGQCYGNCR